MAFFSPSATKYGSATSDSISCSDCCVAGLKSFCARACRRSTAWAVDAKPAGMVHARNVKPPVAGATLVSVDDSSVRGLPGFIKVIRNRNYLAVVCEREEQTIKAAKQLKAKLEKPATAPFPASDHLYEFMRSATPTSRSKPVVVGDPDAAFAKSTKVLEALYEIPFQGHTAIGPAHATADPSDGQMTVYSNDMKSYGLRNGLRRVDIAYRERGAGVRASL